MNKQNQSDGWFIGCTDDLVIGSWVGTQDRRIHFRNLGTGSGGRTAMPMVAALFEYAGQRALISNNNSNLTYFNCPDYLTDEQYAYYSENEIKEEQTAESETDKDRYGGWLEKILKGDKKRKGTLKDQYEARKIRAEIEELKQQRDARMRQYQSELNKWEEKLKTLRAKEGG